MQDFSLLVLKASTYFHFAAYDDFQGRKVTWNAPLAASFEQSWTYIYFGYRMGEAFATVKYATGEQEKHHFKGLRHFLPTDFHITLQKDEYFPPFSGQVRQWNANFGDGSFTTNPSALFDA
jgi:hypothetical protein